MSTNTRPPYEWSSVITWTLSLFLWGISTARPTGHDSFNRLAVGILTGILLAVLGGIVVAAIKYFKPSPQSEASAALASAIVNDKAIFIGALAVAAFLFWKAVYFETYGALIDAAVIGGLGFGVKSRYAAARWLMAAYAFITPFLVIASGGGNAVIWPFVFYAACRSIMAHKNVDASVGINNMTTNISPRPPVDTSVSSSVTSSVPSLAEMSKSEPMCISAAPRTSAASTAQPPEHAAQVVEANSRTTGVPAECFWSAAIAEFEGPSRRPGLWARAFAEAQGNEPVAKANYLRYRADELQQEHAALLEQGRRDAEAAAEQERRNVEAAARAAQLAHLSAQQRAYADLPKGVCPDCDAIIPLCADNCPKCDAQFTGQAVWKVHPIDEKGQEELLRAAYLSGKRLTVDEVIFLAGATLRDRSLVTLSDRLRGQTLLHWAAMFGLQQEASLLIANGANAATPNGDGQKPFELAQDVELRGVLRAAAHTNGT